MKIYVDRGRGKLKKNFIYNLIYQFIQIAIPLIMMPYVSRALGADTLGVYNYSYTIASYFLIFSMLGVANYGCRSIAKVQNDRDSRSQVFWSIYRIQFLVALIVNVIYIVYAIFWVQRNKIIAMIQILVVLSGMFDINWFYFGIEKFKLTVIRNVVIKIVTTGLIFLFVKKPKDLILYTFIYALGMLGSQSVVWLFLKKFIHYKKVSWKNCIEHLKPMVMLFVPIIAISLYKYMDKIMLGMMCEYSQVAFYSNSESIISMPAVITTALGTVALPRLTALLENGKKQLSEYYLEVSIQFAMFLSCAMGFGLASISDIFVRLYFGKGFEECATLIFIFFPCVIFQAWASIIRMQFLLPNAHDKVYIGSVILGALSNFIINLMLIPHLQAVGAVIGTVVAEITVALIQTIFSLKYLPILKYLKSTVLYIVVGIMMMFLIDGLKYNFNDGLISLLLLSVIGGLFFVITSIIINWKAKTALYKCVITMIKKRANI